MKLIKALSDTLYQNSYPFELQDPHDSTLRANMKRDIVEMLKTASVRDYKMIDTSWGFEILFRLPHDYFHFHLQMETEDHDAPVCTSFTPVAKKTHVFLRSTKIDFMKAANHSGAEGMRISLKQDTREIQVRAPDMHSYFEFWGSVPYERRLKLAREN